MGWGGFLDGLLSILPIQGRKERWKNQIASLEAQRQRLLKEPANEKTAARAAHLDDELTRLRRLLANASDAR